jgi:DNA-binding MarR family transcriptional regulator
MSRLGGRWVLVPLRAFQAADPLSVALLRRPTHARVHHALSLEPGATQAVLAGRIGLSVPQVSRTLAELVSFGLVERRRTGRVLVYRLSRRR